MPAPKSLTKALAEEYTALFTHATIRPNRLAEIRRIHARILENRKRYERVEAKSGVPWFVVAIIHNLEASLRFDRHLHNGDPLTRRTVRVPAGHPKSGEPPFDWWQSAVDALGLKKLGADTDWSVPGIAFVLERYNGFGYRTNYPQVKSPYLWSFTTAYTSGKYVADHRFSFDAVSQQCGGMALLKHMMAEDPGVAARVRFAPDPDDDDGASPFPAVDPGGGGDDDPDGPTAEPSPPRPPGRSFPGLYLMEGMTGPDVAAVKAKLKAAGCDPGSTDPAFDPVTRIAVMLFQARSCEPSGEPLEIDGVVGPLTWAALFGPDGAPTDRPVGTDPAAPPVSLARAVLDIAADEVGVREVPYGSNAGPKVRRYLSSVGLGVGNPWCMAFVHWCFDEAAKAAGRDNPVPRSGHVRTVWNRARDRLDAARVITAREAAENPALVRPGMVFFMAYDETRGHTGLVVDNVNGRLETIEGNTNDDGHREGNGVFRRTRRRIGDANLGFIAFD